MLARQVAAGTVVALDLSLPMLHHARRRADEEGLENIVFVRASAQDLPLEDGAFHSVNCCGALHLFPDAAQALREVARVLRPGGTFTAAVFRDAAGAPIGAAARSGAIGLHAFRTGELEELLAASRLDDVTVLHRSFRWLVVSARKPATPDLHN